MSVDVLEPVRGFLDAEHKLLIGGDWVAPAGGGSMDALDPATGQRLTSVAKAGKQDVDKAVAAASQAFASKE